MAEFLAGLRYSVSGFGLLGRPGIRIYVLIPLLVNSVLFTLTIVYGTSRFSRLLDQLITHWAWLKWVTWLLWPLFLLLMLGFVFFCFSMLANLIAAPFNGRLATAVEQELTGAPNPESAASVGVIAETINAVRSEAEKIRYFLLRGVPLLVLFLIPVIQLAAPLIWFIYAAWMIALEYLEIPLGNRGMLFPQVRTLAKANRNIVLGYGTGILLLTMMPGVNLMVMPIAVSGATKMALERLFGNNKS